MEELDVADNWIQAQMDVDKILEQAVKTIPVRKIRLNVENARKQFLLMTQLMTKRNETIRQVKCWALICGSLAGLLHWTFFLKMQLADAVRVGYYSPLLGFRGTKN